MANYDEEDLKQFNSLAQLNLKPFGDNEISKNNEGFSYVDPEKYRRRILKNFENGFVFHVEDVKVGETAVTGYGHFIGESEGVKYDIRVFAMEKFQIGAKQFKNREGNWVDNPNAGKPQKQDLAMQMLTSSLLKAVARELGIGLHLYQKEAKQGGSNSGGGSSSSSSSSGGGNNGGSSNQGEWDGEVVIQSGKNQGKKWKDLPDNSIEFLCNMENPNQLAIKERARRKQANAASAQSNVDNRADVPDDDIPF